MASLSSSLQSIVCAIVPATRTNENLRRDLISHCQDILSSNIGQRNETNLGHLVDAIKRRLLLSTPHGGDALKFTNLLSRLLDQPILSRKQEAISFLSSVALQIPPTSSVDTFPSLIPPPPGSGHANSNETKTTAQGSPAKSKAQVLKDYRQSKDQIYVPESVLLRDALYLLQGISGKYVRFLLQNGEDSRIEFVDDSRLIISPPTKTLLHRLAELGYLYTRVSSFVQDREAAQAVGMIEQSLCHHLQTQLNEYYRLIAVLETQMSGSTVEHVDNANQLDSDISTTGLSLRRLEVWVNEWRLRMRMMSVCVEGAREAHGGALVNLIHSYTDNGDPFVRTFTDQLLEEVSQPFFTTLHKWLFSGELYDPFAEFFVSMDAAIGQSQFVHPSSLSGGINQLSVGGGFGGQFTESDDIVGAPDSGSKLWEAKYQFREDMLPLFVGETSGNKIFSTGKSLNFIRYSCHDGDWVVTREKMNSTGDHLRYSDIGGLERSIDAAYRIASHRLFEVFIGKFKLLDHLTALKSYLLLGHGDFADQLMETLGPSLSRPANTLYRHNLTATLETAIRSSNAQNDPVDVLRRLDARMLEYSHGEIGWDVFTLEYKVDAPIDTVLDGLAMEGYLRLFKHMWQMRRIEKALDKGWMRITSGARTFIRVTELEHEWHKIRLVMAEMIHFIRQLEAFCRLEVIECSWKILIDFLNKKDGDLDALIEAHRSYLDRVVKKIFLWNPKSGKEEVVLNQVREIFSSILMYREVTDNFYNYCLSEAARRDQVRDADRGVYTASPQDDSQANQEVVLGLINRLREYGSLFSDKVQNVVQHLQVHPDLDCRFLGIRLSFSDYYKSKKDQSGQQHKS